MNTAAIGWDALASVESAPAGTERCNAWLARAAQRASSGGGPGGAERLGRHAQSLAGALRGFSMEGARQRCIRGPLASIGMQRTTGPGDGAAGNRGELDRRVSEVLSYARAAGAANPLAATGTSYRPGNSSGASKAPSCVLMVERSKPVSRFFAFTIAPVTALPDASRIVPRMLPSATPVCAGARAREKSKTVRSILSR